MLPACDPPPKGAYSTDRGTRPRADGGVGVSVFHLRIRSPDTTIWCDGNALETTDLAVAVTIADRLALACRRCSDACRDVTAGWSIDIISECGQIFYTARVAWASSLTRGCAVH
ncbi:hypothetical protein ASG59_06350 [Methylobacterium sp. Leaf466]|nr:hypothetical protein ASG59_06350 [Methylobacterium sp. Leaf466]